MNNFIWIEDFISKKIVIKKLVEIWPRTPLTYYIIEDNLDNNGFKKISTKSQSKGMVLIIFDIEVAWDMIFNHKLLQKDDMQRIKTWKLRRLKNLSIKIAF